MDTTDSKEAPSGRRGLLLGIAIVVLLLLAGAGYVGYLIVERLDAMERQVAAANEEAATARHEARAARERAETAESSARLAAEGRSLAEADRDSARTDAEKAREQAATAEESAALAQARAAEAEAEAARIRQEAEEELNRLHDALSQIADTRRTALGLVLNLGEDALKFDFDKAELRPENRELLSRIAGILLTSSDYTVSVNGHTDDVGSAEYNQKLSERRAEAVRGYLVEAGVPEGILTVQGWGKTKPLVEGTSDQARAKNRRVELGIVNARVIYKGDNR